MRIAYISGEFPPDTGQGGIATYTSQVARLMQKMGHEVEVFCGSFSRSISEHYSNILTHRIHISNIKEFKDKVVVIFKERHFINHFDIIECAEINGDAYEIKKIFPEIPLVVRMHTPGVLITRMMNSYVPLKYKLRYVLGTFFRGKFDLGYWSRSDKNQANDIDFKITEKATIIVSPSQALKKWAVRFWKIDKKRITVIPNPYIPDNEYLNIPNETKNNRISFIGKLNILKGIYTLTKVMHLVLKVNQNIQFRLIGEDQPSPVRGLSSKQYIKNKLGNLANRVEFTGPVDLDKIPVYLSNTDICIFPSLWENFPTVCLEAMSAGKAIVASNVGGFTEMITENVSGYLVHPKNAKKMAKLLLKLIEADEIRYNFGKEARKTVLDRFNESIVGKEIELTYKLAIDKKK